MNERHYWAVFQVMMAINPYYFTITKGNRLIACNQRSKLVVCWGRCAGRVEFDAFYIVANPFQMDHTISVNHFSNAMPFDIIIALISCACALAQFLTYMDRDVFYPISWHIKTNPKFLIDLMRFVANWKPISSRSGMMN